MRYHYQICFSFDPFDLHFEESQRTTSLRFQTPTCWLCIHYWTSFFFRVRSCRLPHPHRCRYLSTWYHHLFPTFHKCARESCQRCCNLELREYKMHNLAPSFSSPCISFEATHFRASPLINSLLVDLFCQVCYRECSCPIDLFLDGNI